jgi:plastocyanin
VNTSAFVVPPGGSEVNIPPGIQDANAKQLGITFRPVNITVVTGVNNTIYFVDSDVQDNLGHILETTSWPTNGQVFDFWALPNHVCSVTLTTPGLYEYNCEWHPVWMSGTIKVVAG